MNTKQVIVIRKDLKMRRGKEISQGSHSSMAFITKQLQKEIEEQSKSIQTLIYRERTPFNIELTTEEIHWLQNSFTKVCVYVNSEEELIDVFNKAKESGLTVHEVIDNGLTEFGGVKTRTCVAVGPHEESKFIGITDHLSLY